MNSNLCFSQDYAEARTKFLAAARERSAVVESIAHPERGPTNETLATDVALIGPSDARDVLVLISATHGVEGFCGSGAQIDWLRRGEADRLPPETAVLLIHAINPYGFAWLRRVTQENVDLNRNWIDFTQPLPRNAHYDALRSAIVPREWTGDVRADAEAALARFAAENGAFAVQQALTGGQYSHAAGIWFGGTDSTWSRRTQTAIYAEYLASAAQVAILDYHTGLGPWGYAELISTFAGASAEYRRARDWYGASVVSLPDGASSSAVIVGDGLSAAPALLAHAEVTPLALEYGTLPAENVIESIRGDAWLHAHGDPLSPAGREIKQRIRDAFYGDREDWKGMVLGQSLQAINQSIAGFHQAR